MTSAERERLLIQIVDYIKYNKFYGHSKKEIKDVLVGVGWPLEAIDEAFDRVEGKAMPVHEKIKPKVLGATIVPKSPETVVKEAVVGEAKPNVEKPSSSVELGVQKIKVNVSPEDVKKQVQPKSLEEVEKELEVPKKKELEEVLGGGMEVSAMDKGKVVLPPEKGHIPSKDYSVSALPPEKEPKEKKESTKSQN